MEILKTSEYDAWIRKLKDSAAKARINAKLRRMELEDRILGDTKPVGDKVSEMRFDFGPGYRVYYTEVNGLILLLLAGGTKSSQANDIAKAKRIAKHWRRGL